MTPFGARFPELAALEARCQEFELAHRLGYAAGYERGVDDGAKHERQWWNLQWGLIRRTLKRPTHAELQKARGET